MKIDKERFVFLYSNEYAATLNQSQREGLAFLLSAIEADAKIACLQHAAYMLATVKHECAGKWQPIAEFGKGKGYKYGKRDPKTGQTYYGRGYVQLTWDYNYKSMSKVCGVDFLNNPDLVMKPAYAYSIMSHGMRNGSFTGAKLDRFINSKGCNYVNARKIINGLDCAIKIAEYAKAIEGILRLSIYDDMLYDKAA